MPTNYLKLKSLLQKIVLIDVNENSKPDKMGQGLCDIAELAGEALTEVERLEKANPKETT